MTVCLAHRRPGDPWPVLRFFRGDHAEKDAKAEAAKLAKAGIRWEMLRRVDREWVGL